MPSASTSGTLPPGVAEREWRRYRELEDKYRAHRSGAELDLLSRAFLFAAERHRGQTRKTGEPYLAHPLEVAHLLAEMGLDESTLAGGLLHDTLEDTAATLAQIRREFGPELATCVDGVTKIGRLRYQSSEARQAETFRKMVLAMVKDIRVILIKLADRLHNMRTLHALDVDRQRRIALETREIYAPVALRLGMGKVRSELEDLAFRYLEPHAYQSVVSQVESRREASEEFLAEIQRVLKDKLARNGIPARVEGRIKRPYSIHHKLERQKVSFDMVHDLLALRVVTDTKTHCYAAMGVIHGQWHPVPGRIKDFVAMPRPNLYQSLHTTVVTQAGQRFEVQIRTEEMHRDAELGVCAHWSYKGMDPEDDYYANKVAWLRQALDAHEREGVGLAGELIDQIREQRVFVYTPKGHVLDLMAGATAVDFAYRVHTEVGQRCVGARIDGVPAPLNTTLQSGQRVRILTDPDAAPQRAWLDPELGYVRTSRAMSKIRAWFYDRDQGENVAAGRSLFLAMIDGLALPLPASTALLDFAPALKRPGPDGLFFALGVGEMAPLEALRLYLSAYGEDSTQRSLLPELAAAEGPSRYRLRIEGRDREGLLRDLTETVSRYGLSMLANTGHVEPATGTAWIDVDLELEDLYEAARIMHHMRHVPDVRQVRRVALNAA